MTYKLLIEAKTKFTEYKELLGVREFPRGDIVNVEYTVTNIGDNDFVGGILEEVSAEYGAQGGMLIFLYPQKQIPPIPKGKTKSIHTWDVIFIESGLVWLQCKIKPNDDDKIQYFQVPENKGGTVIGEEKWKNYFVVINREPLEMITLLRNIGEKLDKLLIRD